MMALSFINYLGFAGWSALLYNFTVERAAFDWADTGLTQSVREIPGFLAFTAIFWLAFMREQVLAYAALFILGLGVALTGQFPTLTGVLITTFIMSVGFHYFETANASLQMQLLPKAEAPRLMGHHSRGGRGGPFVAYGGLALAWWLGWRSYEQLYLVLGLACAALVIAAMAFFPRFEGPVPQKQAHRAQAALLALLRADLHDRRAPAAVLRLRRLPAGQEVRLLGHRHGAADAGDDAAQHGCWRRGSARW